MACADRNPCACVEDFNRCICSRLRVGRCEFLSTIVRIAASAVTDIGQDLHDAHLGQRSRWQARQNGLPQLTQGASPAGVTRCSRVVADQPRAFGRAAEFADGGSSRRASGFQSRWITRSALRRRICTAKRCTGMTSSSVCTHSTVTRIAYWRARSSSLARYSRPIAAPRCSSRRRAGSSSGSSERRRIASRWRSLW